jgi:hypothetical protein
MNSGAGLELAPSLSSAANGGAGLELPPNMATATPQDPGAPLSSASGSTPPLTGDVNQDANTLQQLVNDPSISDQALQNFALSVAKEAVNTGDSSDASWAIDLASKLAPSDAGTSSPIPSTSDGTGSANAADARAAASAIAGAGTTPGAPNNFANGNASQYKADMETALKDVAEAKKDEAEAKKDKGLFFGVVGKGKLDKAEAKLADAHEAVEKAKSESTNDAELTQATSMSGAIDERHAAAIWQDGQAGPGHGQHDQYDELMDNAKRSYDSIANDPNASSSDISAAQKFSSDISDMKAETDGGNGKSDVYASAAQDFTSGAVLDEGA